jgi:hypothetical protein
MQYYQKVLRRGSVSNFVRDGKKIYFSVLNLIHQDKKLMIIPTISTLICLAIMLLIAHPLINYETKQWNLHHLSPTSIGLFYLVLLSFLFIRNIIHGMSASYTLLSLTDKIDGQWGVRTSMRKLKKIASKSIAWTSFFAFTSIWLRLSDLILSFDSKRRLFGGSQFHFAAFMSSSVVTFEETTPIRKTLQEAGKLITQTWGKPQLKLGFSFHFYTLILLLSCCLPAVLVIACSTQLNIAVWISLSISAILYVIYNSYRHVFNQYINLCMYRYAKHGIITTPFTEEILKSALSKVVSESTDNTKKS